jgi:hypothetical protein
MRQPALRQVYGSRHVAEPYPRMQQAGDDLGGFDQRRVARGRRVDQG